MCHLYLNALLKVNVRTSQQQSRKLATRASSDMQRKVRKKTIDERQAATCSDQQARKLATSERRTTSERERRVICVLENFHICVAETQDVCCFNS